MKIIITINTPAQLHFLKNLILILNKHGSDISLLLRDYGETLILADEMNLKYQTFLINKRTKIQKLFSYSEGMYNLLRFYKKIHPDLIIGSLFYNAIPARIIRKPLVTFLDSTRLDKFSFFINFGILIHFADTIVTPNTIECFLGQNHIELNSYKEFAYLHPNYYKPDKKIKELLNLDNNEEYILLRFNAFDAVHDLRIAGFSDEDKIRLVHELEKYARVYISSEAGVPEQIKDRVLKIPKSRIHDVIYHAKLLVADTGTMVTEAACLGTPAIMFHPKVKKMGNFIELERKYELIFGYERDSNLVFEKAIDLLQRPNLKQEWQQKREKLLKDKIDITAFMVWFVENYPESFRMMKENPGIQERFKFKNIY
ncbi:MAG: DUF354 domain-containing protein [Methanolinea sp.]|nr:DUF354 domain-containing protein [Methanolinea sp.]